MDSTIGRVLRELPGPIAITGHTGFKGTWLAFLLERLNVPIVGLSLAPEKNSLFLRSNRLGAIPEQFLDIRNAQDVTRFMTKYQPSAVIHLAAQSLVIESYKQPVETFETNVLGTVNVLDAAFKSKRVQGIVVATTDKVYRNNNSPVAFIESDPLGGVDPYSASKVGAEFAVSAWQQISRTIDGPKVVSVRAGNVIGGGDWAENRLFPDLIRGFMSKKPIQIRNPKSTRPWQHVLDPLAGYISSLEAALNGIEVSALNFGPNSRSLSVQEVVAIAIDAWPNNVEVTFNMNLLETMKESSQLHLNSSYAKRLIGWEPFWSQSDAITSTVKWWDQVLSGKMTAEEACTVEINELLLNYGNT